MIPTEKELFEKMEEEFHCAALSPEELPPESSEVVRQRRMASVLEELKSVPFAPVELTMLGALENPLERACVHWERLDPFGGPGAPNVTEVVLDFLAEENFNYRDGLLYERMSNEYAAYLDEVREKDPQTIIDNAYQIIIKEDILSLMEGHDLELPQIDVLLTLKCPLDALYWEWLDNDYSHMDGL